MLNYRPDLKPLARGLRRNMTEAEQKLWYHLRRKQLCNVQFNRQRPVGPYIVDFIAPSAKLVIEVDGSQHLTSVHQGADEKRTHFLQSQQLLVLRFDNLQVLNETNSVLEVIEANLNRTL
ncbi:MAG: endonuclease domain-containing protein [Burkholderiales bacterium]|jgi:very-short-patch-repair endonuclease|nr:endonuclease domain-containing protein [Rhodocyclaceae bacterium]MCA3022550.1 endonuclease domain-containing protein [Rhodocyclaceae bacterium]MCA3052665.1 endonuclease domain-containing protein [Rhodocyclaceae bacterium]